VGISFFLTPKLAEDVEHIWRMEVEPYLEEYFFDQESKVNEYRWELYNLAEDFSQNDDLAARMPDKLKQMQALFQQEAQKYGVLPLDNSQFQRAIAPRPSAVAGKSVFTYVGENPGIPTGNAPSILNKSFTITAEIDVPASGGNGMIVTEGGLEGGIGLYLKDGRPTFVYNFLSLERSTFAGKDPLPKGKSQIAVKFDYDGGGAGKGATVTLLVNGAKVAGGRMERTVPAQFSLGEGFDVGMDHGSAVDFNYRLPFTFTGKIDKVTVELR
jgi:arylsulfatase